MCIDSFDSLTGNIRADFHIYLHLLCWSLRLIQTFRIALIKVTNKYNVLGQFFSFSSPKTRDSIVTFHFDNRGIFHVYYFEQKYYYNNNNNNQMVYGDAGPESFQVFFGVCLFGQSTKREK